MGLKVAFSLIFMIFVLIALAVYWFVPLSTLEFSTSESESFSLGNNPAGTQFYPNMRFPNSEISFNIDNCPLQKEYDMLRSFSLVSDKTILTFYRVNSNEEISITCDSKTKIEGNLFIAGEGGPTNITQVGEFNVITKGKILLIKESTCPNPNIGIHELLHVLGFDHVDDSDDIMYPISKCDQEMSPETIDIINNLYSAPSEPDLLFEEVSAIMHGRYLNVNMSVRNNGFKESGTATIDIYADEKFVKQVELDSLNIGHGRIISLTNIWINKMDVDNLQFEIVYSSDELKKDNNKIILKVKK